MPGDFSYDDVECLGSESTLDECSHGDTENCQPEEGAGVRCTTGTTGAPTTATTTVETTTGSSDHYGINNRHFVTRLFQPVPKTDI